MIIEISKISVYSAILPHIYAHSSRERESNTNWSMTF